MYLGEILKFQKFYWKLLWLLLWEGLMYILVQECVVRFCASKRGGTLSHLHMQMVVKLHIWSLKMLNKVLKKWLGWDDSKKASNGHVVHYKQLWNIGFHIFVGMVRYYMKDIDENHFQFVHHNVSVEMMEVSIGQIWNHNNEESNVSHTSKCFGPCNNVS